MCMNTSPKRLKQLRLIGIDIFFNQIALCSGFKQGNNSEIKNAVFLKGKASWN